LEALPSLDGEISKLDLLLFYLGANCLHFVHHLLLFRLESAELIPLLFRVFSWHFHVSKLLYLIAARLDHAARLHQCLRDLRAELLVVKVGANLPMHIFQRFYFALNRLKLRLNLLLLLFALAGREWIRTTALIISGYFCIRKALGTGLVGDCV
jgi:hypothetical protein